MKKIFSINKVIFTAILLLIGCKKEPPPGDTGSQYPQWPVVKTLKATSLKVTTATLNGTVNCSGLSTTVTFEYGTTTSYDSTVTASQSPVTGDGIRNVSADISNLTPFTTYHFRVKAENSKWINFYSSDSTFITCKAVKTLEATKVDSTTARLKGTINGFLGFSTIVKFEYGTSINYGNTVTVSRNMLAGDSITNVSSDISGLGTNSIYHFRIKAENPLWIFYGSDTIFHTTLSSVTDIDSNIYHTIRIGSQVWMQENLKTTRYSNGDLIGTTITTTFSIWGATSPKYQWSYSNEGIDSMEIANAAIYGRLYTWYAVTDSRGVCPTGWHVPSNEEWGVLCDYLGGLVIAAVKIKESGTSYWLDPNDDATNESGFTALPAGIRVVDRGYPDQFAGLGELAYWWTSTDGFTAKTAEYWVLNHNLLEHNQFGKAIGCSVRCIKDN
jgi:uncharacterized protein (TIGR02145 family)